MKRNHLNDFLVEQIKNKDSQIEGLNQLAENGASPPTLNGLIHPVLPLNWP